ncbi:maltose O-acetyltransferase [Tamaricihabitans halophyticus]|uniref:Maltose O-acetyltransferase n=1 Tax=Tamaricihabitans halophyticus TaxID=1262583 RepID=A0A4R2R6Q0_9PSEU|nr:sugar O-acetyltransferase [Tamaricihabitans halophyticus]TCP55015.1 maltose O-acetyltransferase [Tamaricihabitans halophyticus]
MGEQPDRMLRGDWYLDDAELSEQRRHCWRMLDRFNAAGTDDADEHRAILTELFGKLGPGATVLPRFQCSYGAQITVGANSFVNHDAFLMDDAPVAIGDDVRIGPRAQLLTALHPMEDHERRRAGWERTAPITIGDNAWLGGGVIVCPGVTIGANAVIGAGSVVIRDVPDQVFAAGNPARVIRQL